MIHRAYKFRFYPSEAQKLSLGQAFGCARFVYNHFLAARSAAWKEHQQGSTYAKDCKALTALKQEPDKTWLGDVSNIVLQQSLKHLSQAFQNFFSGRGRYPSFKSKHDRQAVTLMRHGFRVKDGQLFLARIDGPVQVRWSRALPSAPSQAVVSRDSAGRYFVSFLCEEAVAPLPQVEAVKAIDLGLQSYIVDQHGEKLSPPKFLVKLLDRVKRAAQALSRKVKGSKNRAKARRRLARLHARVGDARQNFTHQLSASLIRENQAVFAEQLNIKGLIRTRLARSISDAAWGELLRQLAYKASWYGRTFWQAPKNFASSKLCHACGAKNAELTLSQRRWRCVCGVEHDRDTNAARNLLLAGLAATQFGTAGLAGR